ncbi:acetate--CoA ligase [Lysobacter korlensis]|uniref:Acetate--CoA ligase n=1 Tax=Lysobacter korlensis TaxID=553636 RepID=A0ABV6S2Q8_9GAMM
MTIENLQRETRVFPPAPAFAAAANVDAAEEARLRSLSPDEFWAEQSRRLDWTTDWHTVSSWTPPSPDRDVIPAAEWFRGGELNVAVNCVDRHVAAGRGDKVALHFEGEPGDRRSLTYAQLQAEVSRAANALTDLGIGPGDTVVVYLPVLLETVIATLAIARIGAVHSLVFGGFSSEALRFRLADTRARAVVTSDGQFRRGAAVAVKANVDAAVEGLDHVETVLVVRRTGERTPDIPWTAGRDVWWHETVDVASPVHEPESFPSEHPLFVIYTSGTTGRPKGLLHTSGGYLTHASWSHWAAFDAKDDDVYWCTADLAWVTAHTYVIYGPLSNGATQVLYEGTPNSPHAARHFEVLERYGVTVYYTAPTLIRTFMTWFPEGVPDRYDLSAIRLLGTVGEAINPEAWVWFHRRIGGSRAPIVDTWWQSETGAAVVAPLPGSTPLKPGSATRPLPGFDVRIVDDEGAEAGRGQGGYLVLAAPWPGMARTVWKDPERYRTSYWDRFASRGFYFAGDGAAYDEDGYIWLLGRVDDVVNVSGHRLSTIEIESALVAHRGVGEAAVVGVSDPTTGSAVCAFVVPSAPAEHGLGDELRRHVAARIGPIAKPRDVHVVPDLPKTRSGKILRRLLVDLSEGRPAGDTTSLQDESVLPAIETIVRSG